MTRTQIEYLKILGYEDTQENGAILENKLMGNDGFVWKGHKFKCVLANYNTNFTRGYLKRLANRIISEI